MSGTPRRNVTHTDEFLGERVTLRRWYEDGNFIRADVYDGGRRVGIYKTERGAERAALRHAGGGIA